jgi:plastocyanin
LTNKFIMRIFPLGLTTRMSYSRSFERRKAMSNTLLAGIVVVIIVIAAVGAYLTLGPPPQTISSTTSATTSSSSATTHLTTSATTSSSTSSSPSAKSSSSSTSTTASATANTSSIFSFALEPNPSTILVSKGSSVIYPYLTAVPLPAPFPGNETVTLTSTVPNGFALTFVPTSINVTTDQTQVAYATMTISSNQTVTPGTYSFNVTAKVQVIDNGGIYYYGDFYSTTTSLRVKVVNYLVVIPNNEDVFDPNNLTVNVGSTVYWFNADLNGLFDVTFTSGSTAQSPLIQPYGSYSYTFTTPGTYSYHNSGTLGMTGTITVTP